jgi:hypothetical protein
MTNILIFLKILQVYNNEKGIRKGRGFFKAYRMNPYNPLSYILIIVSIPILLILFGIVGLFKEAKNPFKWD